MKKRTIGIFSAVAVILIVALGWLGLRLVGGHMGAGGAAALKRPSQAISAPMSAEEGAKALAPVAKNIQKMEISEEEKQGLLEQIGLTMQSLYIDAQMMAYLNTLMDTPEDAKDVLELYRFWLDTDAPAKTIEKILSQKERYEGEYWYEDAYDELTNHRDGVLDSEAVLYYREQGLDFEDLTTANRLSRKGVCKVDELCKQRLMGKSWTEIAAEIYGYGADLETAQQIGAADSGTAVLQTCIYADAHDEAFWDAVSRQMNGENILQEAAEQASERNDAVMELLK